MGLSFGQHLGMVLGGGFRLLLPIDEKGYKWNEEGTELIAPK